MLLSLKKPSELNPERPPVFCRHFIPIMQSAVSMVYSGGGTGKSFAAIRMAIEFSIETGRKSALWLTEDAEGENKFRFDSLVKQDYPHHANRIDELLSFIPSRPIPLTQMRDDNAELTKEFWQIRLELSDYGAIFVDPLLQFNGCDENSNTHAGVLMGALKEWTDEERKSIILIHHASKTKDDAVRPRGAGEWSNGCRSVFKVSRIANADGKTIDTDMVNFLEVTLVKDNGLSYFFRDETTSSLVKNLRVFPDFVKEKKSVTTRSPLFLSIANHNSVKPNDFFKIEVETFYQLHQLVASDRAYSQYEFNDRYRLGTNNQGNIMLICLDYDDGMTIEKAKSKFSKIQSLIITTRSHQIDKSGQKCDRFRVILSLDTPLNIPTSEYPDFLDALNAATGGKVDPSTKDLARFYFASPENAEYHYSDSDKGLNWRLIYEKMKQEKIKENIEKKIKEQSKPKHQKTPRRGKPANELSKETSFETRNGFISFSRLRETMSTGEKITCQCRHGIDHGSLGNSHHSAFIQKDDNQNVRYHCSGGRCSSEGSLWCEE
jgi:hypothetical protein